MRSLTDRRGIPTHGDNAMARIRLLTAEEFPEQLRAAVGADTKTPLELGNLRFYAHRPELAEAYVAFMAALRRPGLLSRRLVELVRLRVAFHNQCRSCMAVRCGSPTGWPPTTCRSTTPPWPTCARTSPRRRSSSSA
jgi:hypothetical protein